MQKKLTKPQIEVLRCLREGSKFTSTDTTHGFVNGVVVSALERRQLVMRSLGKVYITHAGLSALEAHEARE